MDVYKGHICMLGTEYSYSMLSDTTMCSLHGQGFCFVGTCKSIHTALFVLVVRAFEGRAML